MIAELLWPAGLTLLLAIGALSDIKDRRLPNWLSLLLLIYGLAHGFYLDQWAGLGWHGLHALIALLVGMPLFAMKWFGGGDVKFYTGAAAFFAVSDGVQMLLWVSLLGVALMLGWIVLRRLIRKAKSAPTGNHALFPYGVAIMAGAAALAWSKSPII
ncbi:A24 family peptidase [Altererythrobacter lutimaris]|uniref:Prepilin peptidase n=1 Tax=Altererythrobacter lutimaris TaxID=2743979 RepID=A0A850H4V2_9SPHN|nr:prepilin peptidase [Altererythrobacter lutimaris]NVE94187.1 prepilin peptidase [Altererythrobacter lutimaris]